MRYVSRPRIIPVAVRCPQGRRHGLTPDLLSHMFCDWLQLVRRRHRHVAKLLDIANFLANIQGLKGVCAVEYH